MLIYWAKAEHYWQCETCGFWNMKPRQELCEGFRIDPVWHIALTGSLVDTNKGRIHEAGSMASDRS